MALRDEVLGVIGDRSLLAKIGEGIAEGMANSNNSSSFSKHNPTGEGRAGGRGGGDAVERQLSIDEIRIKQQEHKYANQLTKSFKSMNKALEGNIKDTKGWSKDIRRNTKAFSNILDKEFGRALGEVAEGKRSEANLIKSLNGLLDEEITTLDDVLKIRQKQEKLEKQILDTKQAVNKETIIEHQRLSKALAESTHGVKSFTESLGEKMRASARAFFSFEAAILNATIAARQFYGDVKSQLKYGSQLTIYTNQLQAMLSGMDPSVLTEFLANSRQASLTMGSVGEYLDVARDQQIKYYNQIGDLTESMRFATDTMHLLGRSGIRPTAAAMDDLGGTFRVLNKIAGVTSEQFSTMMETTLADEDIQTRLRVASEGQRRAIVQGIAKQIEMNVAMGLTAEQAQAAAVAMGKIAGGGARERFKRAAQMQMAFGAMGVEGGARAAELVRKGQARLSPGERAELEQLTTALTEKATAAKGGGFNQEFVRDTILDKTGLNQYFGESSPLNKQLAEGLAANKSVLEEIRDSIRDGPNGWESSMIWIDKIGNFFVNGALGKLLMSVAQVIGAYVLGRGALGMLGKGGMGAGLGAAARGGAGMLRGGASVLGRGAMAAVSSPAGMVVGAGLAGAAVGTGIYHGVKDKDWFTEGADSIFGAFDHVAQLWSDDAADRVRMAEEQEQQQQQSQTNLEEPAKRTAEATEKQLTLGEKQLQATVAVAELLSGEQGRTSALNRINNLQNGQQATTV